MSRGNKPILCYVTDRRQLAGRPLRGAIEGALEAGADWVQIREKDLPTRELLAVVSDAVAAAAAVRPEARIMVNDRLDVALAAGAHGVHLGGESLPVADVVRWLGAQSRAASPGSHFHVGASCHSVEDVRRAERDGASYAILGPIFETPSKLQYGAPLGVELLAEACRAVRIPVLAIGGITGARVPCCMGAGASGVAAIRMFQQSPRNT